ncbi:MAG: enolase, partial [Thaumarchaeota archaeon S15]
MAAITSVAARVIYNSRASEAVEADIAVEGGFRGRACAPSGASVGAAEAVSLPGGGAAEAARLLREGAAGIVGADAGDVEAVHSALRGLDGTQGWSRVGGSVAYAVSVAAAEAAANAQ